MSTDGTYDRTNRITRIAAIAALYAATTLACMVFLGGLSWGPVQFRLSEALCVLALFTPDAIWGLTLGCAIANLINIPISGIGALGLLDVVFGSLATFIGTSIAWRLRDKPLLALLGPILANAIVVPIYLPLMLQGLGFYTIPFTSTSLDGAYLPMLIFGFIAIGIGEAVVIYALGVPLQKALGSTPLFRRMREEAEAARNAG